MTLQEDQLLPQHVAIIMDGNNRFAKKMQMQKGDGHREGKNVLIRLLSIVKVGVQALTVFAFSSENWNRPQLKLICS
jgi:undecaprenyl diphosphate synthase